MQFHGEIYKNLEKFAEFSKRPPKSTARHIKAFICQLNQQFSSEFTQRTSSSNMKFFVAFITTFLCVSAYRVRVPVIDSLSSASTTATIIPQSISSISSASSEELLLLPSAGALLGVGIVHKPISQAVKVKLPQYGNVLDVNHYLAQILAPQDAAVPAVETLEISSFLLQNLVFTTIRERAKTKILTKLQLSSNNWPPGT
ncbi:unnamed protein product [Ceratitis capitata]|uniref:(Mediterranean fruit fly) hypothetical protein n=1 Tax=Ceratitis capitata TaxID=7213 RepID=A0A811V8B4_CERCA|nr:unnamed protein product [Ceratitis capitata]